MVVSHSNSRSFYIDIVRTIAVTFMVIGHCIQYGSGMVYYENSNFLENNIFKWIYSFHMPLFIVIAGYLFYYSVEKHTIEDLVWNKTKHITFPLFSWCSIDFVIDRIREGGESSVFSLLKEYCSNAIGMLWFLWAIIFLMLIMVLIRFVGRDSLFFSIFVACGCLLLPDKYNLVYVKWLLPYYLVGYYWNKYQMPVRISKLCQMTTWWIAGALAIVHIILLDSFERNNYIYVGKMYLFRNNAPIEQFYINSYRWIVGFVGIAAVMMFVKVICDFNKHRGHRTSSEKVCSIIGTNSLGIYVLNYYINLEILLPITGNMNYSLCLSLLESILVLALCVGIIGLIGRNKIIGMVLLGKS